MTDIRLGSINGSHGIKGWVKVFSYTEPKEAILGYPAWNLKKGGKQLSVTLEQSQVNGKRLIARFEGVDTRTLADELNGFEIYVDQRQLPELVEGEYYWHQLQGLLVRNERGEIFGRIDHLLETGANDVLVVRPDENSTDDRERLIPYVEDSVIRKVDLGIGEIVVDWEVDY